MQRTGSSVLEASEPGWQPQATIIRASRDQKSLRPFWQGFISGRHQGMQRFCNVCAVNHMFPDILLHWAPSLCLLDGREGPWCRVGLQQKSSSHGLFDWHSLVCGKACCQAHQQIGRQSPSGAVSWQLWTRWRCLASPGATPNSSTRCSSKCSHSSMWVSPHNFPAVVTCTMHLLHCIGVTWSRLLQWVCTYGNLHFKHESVNMMPVNMRRSLRQSWRRLSSSNSSSRTSSSHRTACSSSSPVTRARMRAHKVAQMGNQTGRHAALSHCPFMLTMAVLFLLNVLHRNPSMCFSGSPDPCRTWSALPTLASCIECWTRCAMKIHNRHSSTTIMVPHRTWVRSSWRRWCRRWGPQDRRARSCRSLLNKKKEARRAKAGSSALLPCHSKPKTHFHPCGNMLVIKRFRLSRVNAIILGLLLLQGGGREGEYGRSHPEGRWWAGGEVWGRVETGHGKLAGGWRCIWQPWRLEFLLLTFAPAPASTSTPFSSPVTSIHVATCIPKLTAPPVPHVPSQIKLDVLFPCSADLMEGPVGYDLSHALWKSDGWREMKELRKKLENLKELRDLVRKLGRASGKGPKRRAPEEVGASHHCPWLTAVVKLTVAFLATSSSCR